jgi:hypothetical protein
MAVKYQYFDWCPICRIPGRMVCFEGGNCQLLNAKAMSLYFKFPYSRAEYYRLIDCNPWTRTVSTLTGLCLRV